MKLEVDLKKKEEAIESLDQLVEIGVLYSYESDGIYYYGVAEEINNKSGGYVSDALVTYNPDNGRLEYDSEYSIKNIRRAVKSYNRKNNKLSSVEIR